MRRVFHDTYAISEQRIVDIVCGRIEAPADTGDSATEYWSLPDSRHTPDLEVLQRLAGHASLPPRDAQELAVLWVDGLAGSVEARCRLVTHYARLARDVCGRLALFLPHAGQEARCVKASIEAFVEALDTYRSASPESFEEHATRVVANGVIQRLRANLQASPMGCWWVERLVRTMAELRALLSRPPTDGETASALGLPLEALLGLYESQVAAILAMELVPSVRGCDGARVSTVLAGAIDSLSPDEQLLLSLYYCEGLSLAELVAVLGVDEQHVRQVHGRAMAYLSSQMAAGDTRSESAPDN